MLTILLISLLDTDSIKFWYFLIWN